ncbi:MAG: glycosyltransferase family 4 protein [bacterium]|nr:glycosyltransferase family 4 protein [bacterium]
MLFEPRRQRDCDLDPWRPLTLVFVSDWDPDRGFLEGGSTFSSMPGIFKLLLGYEKAGHRVHYVYGSQDLRRSSSYTSGRVTVHNVRLRPRLRGRLLLRKLLPVKHIWRWTMFCWLLNSFRRCHPDTVCALKFTHLYEAFLVARLTKVPLIYREYGVLNAYSAVFEKRSLVNIYRVLPILLPLFIPAEEVIITNDGTRADELMRKLRPRFRRLHYWVNGVDKEMLTHSYDSVACRRHFGLPSDSFVLLTLSRLEGNKRVDRALRLLAAILTRHPEAHLAIAGEGEQKTALVELTSSLGITKHVTFLGSVNHSEIGPLLSAAGIFLALSDFSNVGNTLLEALAAGMCIVTLAAGATVEFVENGKNGVLLRPSELHRLPDVICWLIENPEERLRLQRGAAEYADRNLESWSARIQREINLVEQACGIEPSGTILF